MKIHQIWHGDSVEMCQRFKEESVDCIITDPPFGVDNLSNMAVTEGGKKYARKIANDESPEIAIKVFKEVMSVLLTKTKPDCDLYVFTAYQVLSDWLVMLDEFCAQFGFVRKAVLVWEKDGPGMGDLESWGQGHEFIIFFKKGRAPRYAKRRNGVLHFSQLRPNELIHPHEKPPALLETLIKHSTQEGAFLVDPFGGSGSLVRAARNCGRNAVAIELDERNFLESAKKLEEEGDDMFADFA
ncbi:DNA methylase [Gordonia phage GourdThymes]|uniref:DNA methylase n=9 Tax=Montyvirus TaxID=2733196 RepID=A0A2L1IVG2_9CAUD|nr:DNA methylase [Gordonia phage Monty]YP_009795630.1 DNA methylase [Gordonia phage BirksAndSocks]YP_009797888.1 DNA methylase [Gordonia phage Flakey]YP_009837014.1 DNA methylase [Gordonia phage Adgers]YP_009848330.1 DNA methylase [Gordonia phage Beaver]YP_009853292.1 DNA methylase [Gordonia phage Jellybones]YP_009856336.1 DNA methylase [Gordonia phage John316]QDF17891.1 DNA methylase [Gordonia phage Gorko]QIQ62750.1 DNA methylase [Gordonia phage Breezic]QOP64699.1 DNA methylase [Gordonia 